MIGKFLSKAIRIITVPVDVAEVLTDVACGGDGTRADTSDIAPSSVRDRICEAIEEIDE